MFNLKVRTFILYTLCLAGSLWALSNTTGTPIGGMGTGYMIYDARTGDFATSGKMPPAGSDQVNEFGDKMSTSSGFHFCVGGVGVPKAKTTVEDAKCPLYTADYGKTGDVNLSLRAFGPFIPGDNELYYKLATSPLAYFEITAKNEGSAAVDVAVAMEFANKALKSDGTMKNLLGGTDDAVVDAASGNRAISFPGTGDAGNAYLMVDCDNAAATFSAGGLGTFLTGGTLDNAAGNLVAGRCNIAAGASVRFKFTMAWWRTHVSTGDRYGKGSPDEDNYYYHNFFNTSKEAALFGVAHFDMVRDNLITMVHRVMSSNFPAWYNERLLNNLYPLIHNSVCTKDGRTAFWEGLYPIIGTIDQAQHASIWYTHNWPKNQWQEMQYWIRTAHRGVNEDPQLKGQIHHDFNISPASWTVEAHFLCPWDDYLRQDYWFQPNTTDWSDLNTMAIFKLYELMLATGDLDSMKAYFPKIIPTAERLLVMCANSGKHLPTKSKSTYDSEGHETPQYASGIALTGFLAMEEMAKFVGDAATATKYREWYTIARQEFKTDLYNSNFCAGRNYAEGDIAGYSWGNYFCLEPVMDADVIADGCKRLWQMYSVEPKLQNKLGRWHFYTCDHWGGAEIARGVPDTAMIMFKWDYDFYHEQAPSYVFWQDLWENHDVYASYMTAPCAWRSYFQMTGYLLDNANNRLWIRPKVPTSMGRKITNAPMVNSKGWGTLYYDETGDAASGLTQKISVMFDRPVTVKELVLKNNTGGTTPFVIMYSATERITGMTVTAEDWGVEQNIRVNFATPVQIDQNGVNISVYAAEVGTTAPRHDALRHRLGVAGSSIRAGSPVRYTVDRAGAVSMELLALNGAKIGTIMRQKDAAAGGHAFVWNGRTVDGRRVPASMAVVRLVSAAGSVSKVVMTQLK